MIPKSQALVLRYAACLRLPIYRITKGVGYDDKSTIDVFRMKIDAKKTVHFYKRCVILATV